MSWGPCSFWLPVRLFPFRKVACWPYRCMLASCHIFIHDTSHYRWYVSHCDLCLCTKIQRRLLTGELQPLPIPEERWDVISVDFISELLESGGYGSVMVAIDSIGKCSHFVKMVTTVTAAGAANLYLQNVWKLHSLPRKVISDRGLQFVAAFMKELYQLLGIEATTSTTYHPQTDGQME